MILLIDNYDSFTWNLVHRIAELDPTLRIGTDLMVVRNDAITPEQAAALDRGHGPSHVVVSPGPCTPKEAGVSSSIMQRFAGVVPVLGVCLGHQCMGDMHGMRVRRHSTPVHGRTSMVSHDGKGLFADVPSPMQAMRYHSLIVDAQSVPSEPDPATGDRWEVSAWLDEEAPSGSTTRMVMGLRRAWADPAKHPMEGVQFHPESFMTPLGYGLLANFLRMGPRPRSARVPAHAA